MENAETEMVDFARRNWPKRLNRWFQKRRLHGRLAFRLCGRAVRLAAVVFSPSCCRTWVSCQSLPTERWVQLSAPPAGSCSPTSQSRKLSLIAQGIPLVPLSSRRRSISNAANCLEKRARTSRPSDVRKSGLADMPRLSQRRNSRA